jgi:hypothetical protein
LYRLRAGQIIKIDGVAHTVEKMVEFRQGSFRWKEYALEGERGKRSWLSVERDETIRVSSLFHSIDARFSPDEKIVHEGREYVRYDSGLAEVRDFFGGTARVGDLVEFDEYRDKTALLLSREVWPDRVEYSAGVEIPWGRIVVKELSEGAPFRSAGDAFEKPSETEKNSEVEGLSGIKGSSGTKGFSGIEGAPDSGEISGALPVSYEKLSSLPLGQELQIGGTTYCVVGYVRYRQGLFTWTEYELESSSGPNDHVWLSVERDGPGPDDGGLLSLHSSIPFSSVRLQGRDTAAYSGATYQRVGSGSANVVEYRGNGDYDSNESFTFTEYRSEAGEILTCEYWSDEKEASLGRELPAADVRVLASRRRVHAPNHMRGLVGILIFLALIFIEFVLPRINMTPRIERQLASDSRFAHATSVTLSGNRRGQVYSTSLSPDEACRAIIDMDPDRVQYVTTPQPGTDSEQVESGGSERDERLLQTTRETVMIYESEDGTTCVQVSPTGVDAGRYTVHRSRFPMRARSLYRNSRTWYERSGRAPDARSAYAIDASGYSSTVTSARQASAARRSSGGGRSFGK